MATYLDMHNALRGLLREETIGAIANSDMLTGECGRLLNRAARTILSERDWPFLVRHDGVARYVAPITGTAGTFTNGSTSATLRLMTSANAALMIGKPMRVVCTNETNSPNTSYRILYGALNVFNWECTLGSAFIGSTSAATSEWTAYSDEAILPATVRRVLSVRHEETPLRLVTENASLVYDELVPRPFDTMQERPEVAFIGGTGTTTYATSGSGTTGMILRLYPIPSVALMVHYDYIYQHAEMTAEADTLYGVPDAVVDLIVLQAYYTALTSNLQNDPERALIVRRMLEADKLNLISSHRPDPYRRNVPRPFGSLRKLDPYRRWASRTVPEA